MGRARLGELVPSARVYADQGMDPAVAIILGVLVGGVLTWAVSLFQRKTDREARATERKYEQLHAASRLLRVSIIQAAQLHHSRTYLAMFLDVTSWPSQRWAAFANTLADAGAALALVVDEVAGPVAKEYENAAQELLGGDARRSAKAQPLHGRSDGAQATRGGKSTERSVKEGALGFGSSAPAPKPSYCLRRRIGTPLLCPAPVDVLGCTLWLYQGASGAVLPRPAGSPTVLLNSIAVVLVSSCDLLYPPGSGNA